MFSVGMYVSCPIIKNGYAVNVLGRITEYDEEFDVAVVDFFDNGNKNTVMELFSENSRTYFTDQLIRTGVMTPSKGIWHRKSVNILCELSSNKNTLKAYCIQYIDGGRSYLKRALESEIEIDFYWIKNSALREAVEFLNCDTKLFSVRTFLSKRKRYLYSLDGIISTIVDTRVNLYAHQISAVAKATSEKVTRVMLADEVGLGKTIEALTILKFYKQKNINFRCLIVVPSTLEYQWANEATERFDIDAESFSYYRIIYHRTKATTFIISYEEYKRYFYELEEMKWDMLVIDEAHKVLNTQYFHVLMRASRKANNVILLSATPITHDGGEYLQLMKLLNPMRYGDMSIDQFRSLMLLQGIVREKLFDMNNDLEFFEQIDMTDSYVMNLEEINEDLNDGYLKSIISAISFDSGDKGLYTIKLALEYLRKQYIIESNVIRHRRIDIPEARIQRRLRVAETYSMEGADFGIYESNLYDSILDLIDRKINHNNKDRWIRLLEAMHSSPYALLPEYENLEISIEEKRECYGLIKKWKAYCDFEIDRIIKGREQGYTRFGKLVEIIKNCNAGKVIIFSDFKETAVKIYSIIQAMYGEDKATLFTFGMSRLESQLAARKFQNEDNCRFIICDRSGGEGRNFQNADVLIHFDMSWSPSIMEQRIGRLDRIGRDVERDVESIVIYAADTVEETIFNIYNDSLKVFSRSLCGLEIIFEELQKMISDSFTSDVKYGLSHARKEIEEVVKQMEESVEREIYYSTSNETSVKEQAYIKEVTTAFERICENDVEHRIIELLKFVGIKAKIDVESETVSVDCDNVDKNKICKNLSYEVYGSGKYNGTFRREFAVKHDSVDYFSTNHFLYRTAMDLVDRIQEGRFHAISASDEKVCWAGFVFVWNIDFNHERLLKGGLNPQKHQYIRKFLNEQQVTNAIKIYGNSEFNECEIIDMINNRSGRVIEGIKNTVGYGILYEEESWEEFLMNKVKYAKIEARMLAQSCLKRAELFDYLSRIRITHDLCSHTVCRFDRKEIEFEKTIKSGLNSCELQLDSISYIEL